MTDLLSIGGACKAYSDLTSLRALDSQQMGPLFLHPQHLMAGDYNM